MTPSQTKNSIRLRERRRCIRLGLPIPRMTKEERSAASRNGASGRVKKGWIKRLADRPKDLSTLSKALKSHGLTIAEAVKVLGIAPQTLRCGWRDGNGIGAKMLREFEKERGLNLGIREPLMDTPYQKNARYPGHKWMSPALKKLFP